MSQQTQYEIEGRVGGPFTLVQLQLMAASGMLQPHDRIHKRGSAEWHEARSIRELFSPAPLVPTAAPRTAPVPHEPESSDEPPETMDPDIRAAFDFFSTPAPPAAAAKPKEKTPAPPAKPAPVAFELPRAQERPTVASTEPDENPFDFRAEPAGPAKRESKTDDQDATVLMDAQDLAPKAGASDPITAARARIASTEGKKTEFMIEPKQATKREQTPAPKNDDGGKANADTAVATAPTRGAAVPAMRAEVTGNAIELVADGTARPMDGKSVFRLHRSWLLFATKFNDETSRAVYLRLEQIDAGIIEHRPAPPHSKGGPYAVLTFSAGEVHVSLAFQGSEKLYRAFLEKVLMQCNTVSNHSANK
jgi:uncharacterized protein DUF4339